MRTSVELPSSVCKDLKIIVKKTIELCGTNLKQIVLFGSFATCKYQPDSDYDICFVLKEVPTLNKDKQNLRNIAEHCGIDKDIDVVLCSTEDLETGQIVFKYIRKEGVILYG